MALHYDGTHYNSLHLAAAVAQAARQVWFGGETPKRMMWRTKPDAITKILDRQIARQRQIGQLRRLLLDALGRQLSALPPPLPVMRVSVKVPAIA